MLDQQPDTGTLRALIDTLAGGLYYTWFVLIAIIGGTVNYIGRIRRGEVNAFSVAELLGEWLVSGFIALLTAYLCIEMEFSWEITAFLCGIAGHMGGRGIYLLEAALGRYIATKLGIKVSDIIKNDTTGTKPKE